MRAFLLLLACACVAQAEVKIGGTVGNVPAHDLIQLKAEGAPPGAVYFWSVSPRLKASQKKQGAGTLDFAAAPGRYTVQLRAVWIADKATGALAGEEVEAEVVVSTPPPEPGPKPPEPGPGPGPKPVGPLAVLVVYEKDDLAKYSEGHKDILQGQEVRDWLEANCAKEADGKTKAYRIWDKDADGGKDRAPWAALMARPRTSLPWVVIAQGAEPAYEGPLPAGPTEFIVLARTMARRKP